MLPKIGGSLEKAILKWLNGAKKEHGAKNLSFFKKNNPNFLVKHEMSNYLCDPFLKTGHKIEIFWPKGLDYTSSLTY